MAGRPGEPEGGARRSSPAGDAVPRHAGRPLADDLSAHRPPRGAALPRATRTSCCPKAPGRGSASRPSSATTSMRTLPHRGRRRRRRRGVRPRPRRRCRRARPLRSTIDAADRRAGPSRRCSTGPAWTLPPSSGDLATFRPPDGRPSALPRQQRRHRGRRPEPGSGEAAGSPVARRRSRCRPGPRAPAVDGVERRGLRFAASTAPRVLVWSSASSDAAWAAALAEPGRRRRRRPSASAPLSADGLDAASRDHDVVVVLEPHVLPLPGAIEAAAALAWRDPDRAVAGKVLRADGRLESAGGTVFSDRSVALIAEGSPDVRAPWHEYVRPVCWAPGLLAAAPPLWPSAPAPPDVDGPRLPAGVVRRGLGARCARSSTSRRWPRCGSPATAASRRPRCASSAWQRVLDLRPAGPTELSDGAWRLPPRPRRRGGVPRMSRRRALVVHTRMPAVRPRQRLAGRRQHHPVPPPGRVAASPSSPARSRASPRSATPSGSGSWASPPTPASPAPSGSCGRASSTSRSSPSGSRPPSCSRCCGSTRPDTRVVINSMDVHFLRDARRAFGQRAQRSTTRFGGDGRAGAEHLRRGRRRHRRVRQGARPARRLPRRGPGLHPPAGRGRRARPPFPLEERRGMYFVGQLPPPAQPGGGRVPVQRRPAAARSGAARAPSAHGARQLARPGRARHPTRRRRGASWSAGCRRCSRTSSGPGSRSCRCCTAPG